MDPGKTDFLWAFQVTLVGSLALGLGQLLAADHDGEQITRRDVVGLLSGLAGLACSSTSLLVLPVVGVVVFVRRGWRRAAFHVVPVVVTYGTWLVLRPDSAYSAPPPEWASKLSFPILVTWMRRAMSETVTTFAGTSHWGIAAFLVTAVLTVGAVLAWFDTPSGQRQQRLLVPGGLAVGSLLVMLATGSTRWWYLEVPPTFFRYTYLFVALMLPFVATSIEALARRWKRVAPVFAFVVLIGVPGNVAPLKHLVGLSNPFVFGDKMSIEGLPALPVARDADPTSPVVSNFGRGGAQYSPSVGWVLQHAADGRINVDHSVSPRVADALTVWLGLDQLAQDSPQRSCKLVAAGTVGEVYLERGDAFSVSTSKPFGKPTDAGQVEIELENVPPRRSARNRAMVPHSYQLAQGTRFQARMNGLQLRVSSPTGAFQLCR